MRNFTNLANAALSHRCKLSQSSRALALLVVDTCVLQMAELDSAYRALPNAFRVDGDAFIEWTAISTDRTERRAIGVHLQILLGRICAWPSYGETRRELEHWIVTQAQVTLQPMGTASPLEWLLIQAQTFARLHLPNALFAHVSGLAPLTVLPRSCWARLATGDALQVPRVEAPSPVSPITDRTFEKALDAALLGQPNAGQSAPAFIRRLLSALRPSSGGSVASRRQAISMALCALESDAQGHCTAVQILFAMAIHLHENGTSHQSRLAPATPYDYLQVLAIPFFTEFVDVRFERMDAKEFSDRFLRLWSLSPTPKHGAACRALYIFLRTWDIAPKLLRRADSTPDLHLMATNVRANVIHRHEIDLLFVWLEGSEPTRLNQSLQCALALLEAVPMRVGELISLRIEGFRAVDGEIEVDIAPRLSDPRLKSRESRRRVMVTTPRGVQIVGAWLKRRIEEETSQSSEIQDAGDAKPRGYLFGDPNMPNSVYRPTALVSQLNKLLKAVTGDSTVSVHTLRHGWATRAITQELCAPSTGEVNGLEVVAMHMGHTAVGTTVSSYFHTPELVVRTHWDRALSSVIPFSSLDLELWTGAAAATWRQRLHRWKTRGVTQQHTVVPAEHFSRRFAWEAMRSVAKLVNFSGPEHSIPMGLRCIPLLEQSRKTLAFTSVLGALTDLSRGLGSHQVALRQQLSAEQLQQILDVVIHVANVLNHTRHLHKGSVARGVELLLDTSGKALGIRPDFQRAHQQRWQPLRRWLERQWMDPMAHAATEYWLAHVRGGCLEMNLNALDFLRIFPAAGCSSALSQLHVNHSNGALNHEQRQTLKALEVIFYEAFGQGFTRHFLAPRRGRPLFQFVFGASPASSDQLRQNGAAQSLAGLHCLMLVTLILQRLWSAGHE
jgi:integrase